MITFPNIIGKKKNDPTPQPDIYIYIYIENGHRNSGFIMV
jgi:hypothetical protein